MNNIALDDAYAKWADELVGYATVLVGDAAAADVVADTFAELLERERRDTDQDREATRWQSIREPRAYLFRCVLNTAKMRHRGGSRRSSREVRAATQHADWTRPVDALVTDPLVTAAIDSLSVQQRAAIYLTYWADLPITEVAQHLDCREGTAKRHLSRARAMLRNSLERKVRS